MSGAPKRVPARYLATLREILEPRGADVTALLRSVQLDAARWVWCFSEPANFSRAFRRVMGMAPGEYQQRQALGAAVVEPVPSGGSL